MRTHSKRSFKTNKGDVEITVIQLDAMTSGKLLLRLGADFGPTVTAMALAWDGKSRESLPNAIRDLFAKFDGEELQALTQILLFNGSATYTYAGESNQVDQHFDLLFRGHIGEWFKLLWFALEVNYGNFIGALGESGALKIKPGGMLDQIKQAIQSGGPITSSGQPKD